MNIKEVLENALLERYKANSVIDSLQKEIKSMAKNKVMDKYSEIILVRGSNNYKLHGLNSYCYITDPFERPNVDLSLYFICIDKMTKQKQESIKKEIERYRKDGRMYESNHKIPAIIRCDYEVPLDQILNNNFNLLIN